MPADSCGKAVNPVVSVEEMLPIIVRELAVNRSVIIGRLDRKLVDGIEFPAPDPLRLARCHRQAESALTEFLYRLKYGGANPDPRGAQICREIGEWQAVDSVDMDELFHTASALFAVVLDVIERCVRRVGGPAGALADASLVLTQSLNDHMRTAAGRHLEFLREGIHRVRTAERARIARELHDRISNDVGSAAAMVQLCQEYAADGPAPLREALSQVADSLSESLVDIRTMTMDMRSPLGRRSFASALSGYRDDLRSPVTTRVRVQGCEGFLPDRLRDELFLVVREAMRNAILHAGAAEVAVTVSIDPAQAVARIHDNGTGFDTTRPTGRERAGLSTMRERVDLLNGELDVVSTLGAGTAVTVRIPLGGGADGCG
jgi:signal transduction histidine kinase